MTTRWRMSPIFVLRHAGMPFEWLATLAFSPELIKLADHATTPAAVERFRREYSAERIELRAALHRRAGQPEFRDAVFISNPGMAEGMLLGYLDRDTVPDNARFRRVERQVYRYLQRFCGKNETTSAYGPIGYGEVDGGRGLRIERRRQRRRVMLGRWALEELAQAVARDPALRTHVPVRRSLLADAERVSTLSADQQAVWRALGAGPLSVAELADRLGTTVGQTAKWIRPLLAAGVLYRGLVFAADVVDGLAELRAAVAALPGLPQRDGWLARLDLFAAECREFAAADLAGRQRLLVAMEARFTTVTGAAARRGAGEIYADRLILFEEASSPFHLRIGADLAREIERQAGPCLDLCAAGGTRVQREYGERMAEVLNQAGGRMRFDDYAAAAKPVGTVRSRFGGHDHAILVDVPAGTEVELEAPDDIGAPLRYALPDICLRAPVRGSPRVLLARAHHHLLLEGWLTTFFADRDRITAQVRSWLTEPARERRLVALATSRRNKGFYRFPGPRVIITPVDHEAAADALAAGDLTVDLVDGQPRLTGPDGTRLLLYPMLADLTTYPPIAALTDAPVLHVPVRQTEETCPLGRVRLGEAVYQRACWSLDLTTLCGPRGAEAFLALRRVARSAGLPRFVFVRAETERKPMLIDTWSPFAADLLCHLSRQVTRWRAEEMLPGPDELWLHDERGHYTCELRIQFLRRAGGAEGDGG